MPKDEELGVKEARSRVVILERVGDILDDEMKPLTMCSKFVKLKLSTEVEARHIIFSRFGTVTSTEIMRDHKTGIVTVMLSSSSRTRNLMNNNLRPNFKC